MTMQPVISMSTIHSGYVSGLLGLVIGTLVILLAFGALNALITFVGTFLGYTGFYVIVLWSHICDRKIT